MVNNHVRARRRGGALTAAALAVISAAGLSACAVIPPAAAAGRQPAPSRPRPVLISATPIARLSERAVAAELRGARLGPGDPALGAGSVRYGIVAYRVVYRTVTALGRPTRASGVSGWRRCQLSSGTTRSGTTSVTCPPPSTRPAR